MRDNLIQYVNLLFAGTPHCNDMKQEILQNTLDRYDDLISQGKTSQAAYHLAITGIGDISEILETQPEYHQKPWTDPIQEITPTSKPRNLRAIAIVLYILSALPLIILSQFGYDILGLSITLVIVAVATYFILTASKQNGKNENTDHKSSHKDKNTPSYQLKKSIHSIVDAITLAAYFIVSFATKAWAITWIIFPISGCINGLINAVIDLKEANKYEN